MMVVFGLHRILTGYRSAVDQTGLGPYRPIDQKMCLCNHFLQSTLIAITSAKLCFSTTYIKICLITLSRTLLTSTI